MSTASRRVRLVGGLLALVLAAGSPGCATLPGLITGGFTGSIDAPAQVYRYHRAHFDRNPIWWPFNVLLFFPVGLATGPIVGMGKGIAIDVQWLIGQIGYGKVFATYREPSIWRPFTIHW